MHGLVEAFMERTMRNKSGTKGWDDLFGQDHVCQVRECGSCLTGSRWKAEL